MKFKFQDGGAVAPQTSAPTNAAGTNSPEQQIVQMAQEIVNQIGPDAAMALADAITKLVQNQVPQQAPGQPMYQRNGGKIVLKGRK